jgi:hypothetical protein
MHWPGPPFIMILVLEKDKMAATHSHQAAGNPMYSMICNRKGQPTESNALEMSTLNSKQACLLAKISLTDT